LGASWRFDARTAWLKRLCFAPVALPVASGEESSLDSHRTLWLAVGGYAWLAAAVVIAGALYPGYGHVGHLIDELGATGAPDARAFSVVGVLPAATLLMLFAVAAVRALPQDGMTALGFGLFAFYAFGLCWGVLFPCDAGCRPVDGTLNHRLHMGFGFASHLAGVVAPFVVGNAAKAWSGSPRVTVVGAVCSVVAVLAFGAFDPDFRYVGLAQRVLHGALAVWAITCAIAIDRYTRTRDQSGRLPPLPVSAG
jgi:hypothetical protein